MAYVLFGAAHAAHDGRNGNAQRDRCRCHDQAHRDAENGRAQRGGDCGQQAFKGCTDRADQGSDARKNGGEAGQQTAAQALTDGKGHIAQRCFQPAEDLYQGRAEALRLLPDLREAAGQPVHDLPAKVDSSLHQLIAGTAQRFVELSHDAKGKIIDLLLLVGSQTAVDGARHPLADAQPVLILDGGVQIIEGAQNAGICFGLQLLPQAVKVVRAGLFDLLGHLHGAVGRDGLDLLHRHKGTVHHVVVDLGDDLLLGLGAVGQGLGDGLGGGLDPVCQRLEGGSDRLGGLPHSLHGLLDGLGAVRSHLCDGFDVLQHTIHHLPGSLGDDLLLLCLAVGERFGDVFGGAGDLAVDFGRGVRDGLDDFCGGLLRGLAGLLGSAGDGRVGVRGCLAPGTAAAVAGAACALRDPSVVIVPFEVFVGAVPLFRVLALVIVVHVAVVGGIVGVLCRTDTVFQVCQCSRRAPDFGDQLIDPVHHRADGVLCDLFHRRKCGVDGIAEGLAGLIGRHETRCQSCK